MCRNALIDDIKSICELKIRMFEESGHIHLLSKDAKDIIEEQYYKLYSEQKAIHFIEEIEGNIVSCVGAFIKNDIPYCFFTTPFYGFIGDVYTVPECRKKGYATKLTNDAITWLKGQGLGRISLLASTQARSIYEKIGFQSTAEMEMYL